MAYWMLVFSQSDQCAALDTVEGALFTDFEADSAIVTGNESDWRELKLFFRPDDARDDFEPASADEFATVYRKVGADEIGEELADARKNLESIEPASGARWVRDYLAEVKTIYAFTPHHAARHDEALDALRSVMVCIQREVGGLVYAEGEGYSNEEGYQITWEFDEGSGRSGTWWMALLDDRGKFRIFEIDLESRAHEAAFKAGRVPAGVTASSN